MRKYISNLYIEGLNEIKNILMLKSKTLKTNFTSLSQVTIGVSVYFLTKQAEIHGITNCLHRYILHRYFFQQHSYINMFHSFTLMMYVRTLFYFVSWDASSTFSFLSVALLSFPFLQLSYYW